jgi:hypothetical protein
LDLLLPKFYQKSNNFSEEEVDYSFKNLKKKVLSKIFFWPTLSFKLNPGLNLAINTI